MDSRISEDKRPIEDISFSEKKQNCSKKYALTSVNIRIKVSLNLCSMVFTKWKERRKTTNIS